MGVAWRIVAGIHYCCCINYHDVRTYVFVCVYMRVCCDKHRRRTQNSHPGGRCTLGQSTMWETLQLYYSIQIQMGLSGKPPLFITCQKNQGMDRAEGGKLNDSKYDPPSLSSLSPLPFCHSSLRCILETRTFDSTLLFGSI